MQIREGAYYRTRDGRKVGPMVLGCDANSTSFKWAESHDDEGAWDDEGDYGLTNLCGNHSCDLIAKWTDEPAAPPVDLTAITTPFGLLPPDVQEALREHGGPYQCWTSTGWAGSGPPHESGYLAYRVKPTPPAPVCETVTLNTSPPRGAWGWTADGEQANRTHRITFDLIDGVPDCASIRMVAL